MTMKKIAFATLIALGMSAAAIAQQQPGQRSEPSAQPGSSQATPAPRGADRTNQVSFERADQNADGRVSRDEGNDIDGFDFSRADTNNDGSLSRQEYQAAMATSTPREGAASARSGDAAGNSRSTQSGAGASAQQSQSGQRSGAAAGAEGGDQRQAQMSFDTVDKDKDGEISREEANDVDGLNFTAADTDDDQSLSRQEFQVAMAGRQPRG